MGAAEQSGIGAAGVGLEAAQRVLVSLDEEVGARAAAGPGLVGIEDVRGVGARPGLKPALQLVQRQALELWARHKDPVHPVRDLGRVGLGDALTQALEHQALQRRPGRAELGLVCGPVHDPASFVDIAGGELSLESALGR